jgi:hypothetical protein
MAEHSGSILDNSKKSKTAKIPRVRKKFFVFVFFRKETTNNKMVIGRRAEKNG